MKATTFRILALTAALAFPMALTLGCAHEVSHSESDSKGWFGGQTHQANTEYKNADGTTSIETETTTNKDGRTTIVRDRKTTQVDGSVKHESETRTIVKGTDSSVTDTHTTN